MGEIAIITEALQGNGAMICAAVLMLSPVLLAVGAIIQGNNE